MAPSFTNNSKYMQETMYLFKATLHWESKLISSLLNSNVSEERLTAIVGGTKELKFLGVPPYQPDTDRKSGDIIAELTTNLLNELDCKPARTQSST